MKHVITVITFNHSQRKLLFAQYFCSRVFFVLRAKIAKIKLHILRCSMPLHVILCRIMCKHTFY